MKRTITTALLALLGFAAQAQLTPNEDTPTGLVYDFTKQNYRYYVSQYVPSGPVGDTTYADNGLKYTATTNGHTLQYAIYKLIAGNVPAGGMDISSNPVIYLKMKGTVGDLIKVSMKNKAYNDDVSGLDVKERYFSGYSIRQKITCSDYRWYKFDFTSVFAQEAPNYTDVTGTNVAATKNHISSIELNNDADLTGRNYSIFIDSLVMGNTAYKPAVPNKLATVFYGDFTNAYYRGYQPGTNSVTVANNEMTMNIGATSKANEGIQYQLNNGSQNAFFNIEDYRIVQARIKANAGDTIQVNLLYGKNYSYIDGWNYKKILKTSAYEDLSFDFTPSLSAMDSVYLVEFIHNPLSTGAATFYMNYLKIGNESETCQDAVAVNDPTLQVIEAKVYPNPVEVGASITISHEFETVEILNLNGTHIATLQTDAQMVNLPSSLKAGMYIMVMKGQENKAFVKFQVK